MSSILSIAVYTFISHLRNRIFLILVLFGFLLLGSSVLFGLLGQEEEIRILMDFGLSSIEILAALTSVFLMIQLVLEEIETRSIYLILIRHLHRFHYLLGRLSGTLASILLCVGFMTFAHLALLIFKGWSFQEQGLLYVVSIVTSFEKVILISFIALFLSLACSSSVVALVFTLFFWVLGHFAMEMKYMVSELHSGAARWFLRGVYHLIPHFQYMNARDFWLALSDSIQTFVFHSFLYTCLYSGLVFLLTVAVFQKKEF